MANKLVTTGAGTIPTISIGGRVFTSLTYSTGKNTIGDFIMLKGGTTGGGSFSTPRLYNTSAGWAVPASTAFLVQAVRVYADNGGSGQYSTYNIGYGDSDQGLGNTGPANAVTDIGGVTDTFTWVVPNSGFAQTQTGFSTTLSAEALTDFKIPAGKFMFIRGNPSTMYYEVYGYLIAP